MSEPIRGSLELITGTGPDAESRGLVVAGATVDTVPIILTAVHGLTDVATAIAEAGQEAAWTATDARQRPVRVVLWREPDIADTLIGQIIQNIVQQQEGGQ